MAGCRDGFGELHSRFSGAFAWAVGRHSDIPAMACMHMFQSRARQCTSVAYPLSVSHLCNRNSGHPEQCTTIYRRVVTRYAPLDSRLQKALQDAEGRSSGHEHGAQGWVLRDAMNRVLVAPPARGVIVNGNSKVTTADIAATNGVVHLIDTVLMPSSNAPPMASKNIVQLAQGSAGLSTLVTESSK